MCVSTPRKYPLRGYFLVSINSGYLRETWVHLVLSNCLVVTNFFIMAVKHSQMSPPLPLCQLILSQGSSPGLLTVLACIFSTNYRGAVTRSSSCYKGICTYTPSSFICSRRSCSGKGFKVQTYSTDIGWTFVDCIRQSWSIWIYWRVTGILNVGAVFRYCVSRWCHDE